MEQLEWKWLPGNECKAVGKICNYHVFESYKLKPGSTVATMPSRKGWTSCRAWGATVHTKIDIDSHCFHTTLRDAQERCEVLEAQVEDRKPYVFMSGGMVYDCLDGWVNQEEMGTGAIYFTRYLSNVENELKREWIDEDDDWNCSPPGGIVEVFELKYELVHSHIVQE